MEIYAEVYSRDFGKDRCMIIDTIYLVGGFGNSWYVYNAIKETFGTQYKCIVPAEPEFAIVPGAVLFHQQPHTVHVRRADATYGIRANMKAFMTRNTNGSMRTVRRCASTSFQCLLKEETCLLRTR